MQRMEDLLKEYTEGRVGLREWAEGVEEVVKQRGMNFQENE